MASSPDFVQYVIDQLSQDGDVSTKRMFGEYGLYYAGKYFACICDNRLLVKPTDAGRALLPDCPTDLPYEGGSPMLLIEDLEDCAMLRRIMQTTCDALPAPKPKRRKTVNDET